MNPFDGHRVYDGCPDDTLKAEWERRAAIKARAREAGIALTWFPMEEKWGAGDMDRGHVPLGFLQDTLDAAFRVGMELKRMQT